MKNEKKLVSIVIPTYNAGSFIKKTIQSILNQTYRNWELIIVDNHSEDDTVKNILNFEHKRIKLLKTFNKGVIGVSRNIGIKNANGKWISFLDADDWWYPNKLERSISKLEIGFDIVCHAEDWVNEDKIVKTVKYGPKINSSYRNLLFKRNCFSTSAVVVSKDQLINVDCFTENPRAIGVEDYHLWLKLAKNNCKTEFIDEPLGCYRIYQGSQSKNLIRQLNSEKWVINDHFKNFDKKSILDYFYYFKRYFRIYFATIYRWLA